MEILVCVKRVPMVGGQITLAADGQAIDTTWTGFTTSPHEECAVEEAVRIVELHGGSVTVATLGPPEAADQLRDAVAVGATRAVLLETDGREWSPEATAEALVELVRAQEATSPFDLLLFGNEAADTGDFQVPVRVAHALMMPVVTGIKDLVVEDGRLRAERTSDGVVEVYEFAGPAVVAVKEGINLPRYPSLPGRMRAKKAPIERIVPSWRPGALRMEGLRLPADPHTEAEILGHGVDAVPALIGVLESIGLLP